MPRRSKLLSITELSRRAPQKDSLPGQSLSRPGPGRWHALAREADRCRGPAGEDHTQGTSGGRARYIWGVSVVGRGRELREAGRLLDRAAGGAGGLLTLVGAPGSGKTVLAEAAADEARRRGFEVLRGSPPAGQPGRLVWTQLLRDAGAPDELAAGLLDPRAGPLDLDSAARHLASAGPRLIVVDDMDRGGPEAAAMLSVVAARCAASGTAVIATSATPLGLPAELTLAGLSQADLAEAVAEPGEEHGHALWVASRGLPGVARELARELAAIGTNQDPVVHLALRVAPTAAFLDVDANLVRLLELAAERATDDATRARVLARLAGELLGDAAAAARRRALADEALRLARRTGDPGTLAEVLDARLYALWDPAGAEARLAAGSEIIDLARAAGDDRRERHGQFWRFVALMELGRVAEAESALAAFAREADAAGDAQAAVMVTARHAMLAVLRGRLDEASRLTREVAEAARRAGMPDTDAITGTLAGAVACRARHRGRRRAGRPGPARLGQAAAGAPVRGDRGPHPDHARPHRRGRRRARPPAPPRPGQLGAAVAGRDGRPVGGGGRRREHRRGGATGRRAGPVPGPAGGMGRSQQCLGAGVALPGAAGRRAGPGRGRGPALRGGDRARGADRRAAVPGAQPGRAGHRPDRAGRGWGRRTGVGVPRAAPARSRSGSA